MPTPPTDSSALESTVEDSGPSRKSIRITVPPDLVKRRIKETMSQLAREVRIPGFRRGHIPRSVIQKRFGEHLDREIVQHLVSSSASKVFEEQDLKPIGDIDLDWDALKAVEGEPFSFEFSVDIQPTPQVADYKGIEVKPRSVTVAVAEIDEQLERLCRESSTAAPLEEDQGLPAAGLLKGDLRFLQEGREIHTMQGIRLDVQNAITGCDEETFKDRLTGARKGQKVMVPLTFREGFPVEEVIGLEGEVEITIEEAFRIETPSPEEFASRHDFADLEALRESIKNGIFKGKEHERDADLDRQIMEFLTSNTDCDIPTKLVEEETEENLALARKQMESQGLPAEEVSAKIASMRASAEESARDAWKAFFITQAIAQQEKILVTEQDLTRELQEIASRNQSSLQEVRAYYEEKDLLPRLRSDLRSRKVREFLREHSVEASDPGSEEL